MHDSPWKTQRMQIQLKAYTNSLIIVLVSFSCIILTHLNIRGTFGVITNGRYLTIEMSIISTEICLMIMEKKNEN